MEKATRTTVLGDEEGASGRLVRAWGFCRLNDLLILALVQDLK